MTYQQTRYHMSAIQESADVVRPRMYGDDWPKPPITAEELYRELMNCNKDSEGTRLARQVVEDYKKLKK